MPLIILLFIICIFLVHRKRRTFMRGTNIRKYQGDFHGVYGLFWLFAGIACALGFIPGWAMILISLFCLAGIVGVIALGKDTPGYRRRPSRRHR